MRLISKAVPFLIPLLIAGCGSDVATGCCAAVPSLRVINAFTSPVEVSVDGTVVLTSISAGNIGMAALAAGAHAVVMRPIGTGSPTNLNITTTASGVGTIAAVRSASGAVSSAVLDDTNSVVPAGATKVRVLHLAPNAGVIQVYRTQPDYQTPISWQFPFTYQATPTSLNAPFFQSTVGTWEVHVWQTPTDASGWANAPLKIIIPLASGEKKTIVILDNPGGGVRYETY
ncbi:MAG: DUF4397 domain-containing protein [bacterium]